MAWFLALRQIGRRSISLRQPPAAYGRHGGSAVRRQQLLPFSASSNRTLVAHFDGGAGEIVNVSPPARLNFEDAVRRADPSGDQAMAVANYSFSTGDLMAVDSPRFAHVAYWETSLSGGLARPTRPEDLPTPTPEGVVFSGSRLRLTLDVAAGTPAIKSTRRQSLRPDLSGQPVDVHRSDHRG